MQNMHSPLCWWVHAMWIARGIHIPITYLHIYAHTYTYLIAIKALTWACHNIYDLFYMNIPPHDNTNSYLRIPTHTHNKAVSYLHILTHTHNTFTYMQWLGQAHSDLGVSSHLRKIFHWIPYQNPDENVALNSRRQHRFGRAIRSIYWVITRTT